MSFGEWVSHLGVINSTLFQQPWLIQLDYNRIPYCGIENVRLEHGVVEGEDDNDELVDDGELFMKYVEIKLTFCARDESMRQMC